MDTQTAGFGQIYISPTQLEDQEELYCFDTQELYSLMLRFESLGIVEVSIIKTSWLGGSIDSILRDRPVLVQNLHL